MGCRDDIMLTLIDKGMEPKRAFKFMEAVRKGAIHKGKPWADGIEDEILEVFSNDKAAEYIDAERAKAIAAEVRKRIDALESIAAGHVPHAPSSDVGDADDVTAARYD